MTLLHCWIMSTRVHATVASSRPQTFFIAGSDSLHGVQSKNRTRVSTSGYCNLVHNYRSYMWDSVGGFYSQGEFPLVVFVWLIEVMELRVMGIGILWII